MSETISSSAEPKKTTLPREKRDWRVIAIVVIAVLAVSWVGYLEARAWRKASQVGKALAARPEEKIFGFGLRETLTRLQSALFRHQLSGNDPDQENFRFNALEFSRILAEAKTHADNSTLEVIARVDTEFRAFLTKAELMEPVKGIRRDTPASVAAELDKHLEPLRARIGEMLEHEQKLARARQLETGATIRELKSALQISVLALAALMASVVLLMYRAALVPLKSRLSETEAARERHEKLASLGVLATGVAHEIRNPLTAIKFRLFSLKKVYGSGLAENEDFRTIRNEIDRLEKIVRTFLEFARPAEPALAPVSSTELLEDLERLLEPEMSQRKIRLSVEADDSITFTADKQQIEQVLINLAQNAADSMPGGGTITFRARQGAAALSHKSEAVVLLDVADTGPGIPPEIQDRLFDPFFSTKEGGTGLGLAIASRIVERHGGVMQFASRKGHGATFTVVLPLSRNDGANANSAH